MKSTEDGTTFGRRWKFAVVGASLDDRGREAKDFIQSSCEKLCQIGYSTENLSFTIDGNEVSEIQIADLLRSEGEELIIECTTLGFIELAILCRLARQVGVKALSLLYLEPLRYSAPWTSEITRVRDFDLSDEVELYTAVPGWVKRLDQYSGQTVVFFLGFEGQRLAQALEQLAIAPKSAKVVFGVPAFKPGWEMNAFANNIDVIEDGGIKGGISFCGADNPKAVIELLEQALLPHKNEGTLFVVPIGTKPHGIGVALFAACHPEVGLLYDCPKKREKRSSRRATWHLYDVSF